MRTYYSGGDTRIAPEASLGRTPAVQVASASSDATRAILDSTNANGSIQRIDWSSWSRCMMTNCVGVMSGCRYAGPAALKCAVIGCTAVAVACALAELI